MSFRWMEKAERRDFPQGKDPLSLVRKEHSVKELTVSAGKGVAKKPTLFQKQKARESNKKTNQDYFNTSRSFVNKGRR